MRTCTFFILVYEARKCECDWWGVALGGGGWCLFGKPAAVVANMKDLTPPLHNFVATHNSPSSD